MRCLCGESLGTERSSVLGAEGRDRSMGVGAVQTAMVSEGGLPRRLVKATQGSNEGTSLEAGSRELTLVSGLKRKEPISDPVSSLAPFLGPTPVN